VSSPHPESAAHIHIRGRVQGVGFRYFTQDLALNLGLAGWVRNTSDGAVEVYAEGKRADLEVFLNRLRQGPPLSRVESVHPAWKTPQRKEQSFTIR
jgi:acylphosphatase